MKRFLLFLILIVFLLFSHFEAKSQFGYLGKRTQLSLSVLLNTPVFTGSFKEKNYYRIGDEMKEKRDYLDYGLSFEFNQSVGKRIALGFELNAQKFEVFGDRYITNRFFSDIVNSDYERITEMRINSANIFHLSIIPEIVIAQKENRSGVGLAHKIGVGFSLSGLIHKYYNYSLNEFSFYDNNDDNWTVPDKFYLHDNHKPFAALTFMYGLHFNVPITHSIHLKTGFSYYLNFYGNPLNKTLHETAGKLFDYGTIFDNVKRENLFSWNLNTGLVFVL